MPRIYPLLESVFGIQKLNSAAVPLFGTLALFCVSQVAVLSSLTLNGQIIMNGLALCMRRLLLHRHLHPLHKHPLHKHHHSLSGPVSFIAS